MLGTLRRSMGLLALLLGSTQGCGSDPGPASTGTVTVPGSPTTAVPGTTPGPGPQTSTQTSTQANPGTGQPSNPKNTLPNDGTNAGSKDGGPAKRCGEIPYDQNWLRSRLARLSGAADAMVGGQPRRITERFTVEGRAQARAWLKAQYEALGYQVEEDPFTEGVSLIATKPGINPSYYVFSSHYDTVPGTPGADDDATGVITALGIAASLAPCQLDHGVRFITFDQEERKMTGAYHYARTEANERRAPLILGALQIEMTGWDSDGDGAFNIVHCDKPMNKTLVKAVQDSVKELNLPLFPVSGCTTRSDHQAFWSIERPAIAVSELFFHDVPDRNPCYHTPCDTYDKVNYGYMYNLARTLTLAASKLTGAR